MPYEEKAICPHCGKTAIGHKDIKEKFGYRNMGDGRVLAEPWCRECRIAERREKRMNS